MRRYASGERSGHISICRQFREIRIRYVYNAQSSMRNLCDQKSVGFLVYVRKNRAAARSVYRHCLEKSRENIKIHCASLDVTDCCFSIINTMRNARREQCGAVK